MHRDKKGGALHNVYGSALLEEGYPTKDHLLMYNCAQQAPTAAKGM